MSLQHLCSTHTVTFQQPSFTVDASSGAKRESWADVSGLTNLSATVQPATGAERHRWAQRQVMMTHNIYLAGTYAQQILRTHRIKDTGTGRFYIILQIGDEAGRTTLTKVVVREFLP